MQQKKWISIAVLLLSSFITSHAYSKDVVIHKAKGDKEQFIVQILSLILSKTDPEASIKQLSEELPQSRQVEDIKLGKLDLMWAGVDPLLETELMPIRIPLLKGLLGHRIFIIKKENQARFDGIKTLADLKQLNAGQGTLWGDTQILKNAGVPVITTLKYSNLFYMLEGGRFDYFPRAIHEPWTEVANYEALNLTVEKNIMLVYPFAMYLFVSKDNQALHDKLHSGFEMAIADGSFDQLFFNDKGIKDALTKTNIKNRIVIKIENPSMHPDTPTERKEFWLDPRSL